MNNMTDFNDLHLLAGPDAVKECIDTAINSVAAHGNSTGATGQFGYQMLQPVLAQRCYNCHGEQVQMKNVRLDSPELVKQHGANIYHQVVVVRAMPMNNATGLTEAERQLIKQWFEAGARTD